MSAATECAPVGYAASRSRARELRNATIVSLQRPSAGSIAPPVRLTQRGVIVLASVVAALAVGLVWAAWLSAPGADAGPAPRPGTVTVHDGDTLWSIATRVAPDRDPRAEVADLQRRNHLDGVALTAGQVLRTP